MLQCMQRSMGGEAVRATSLLELHTCRNVDTQHVIAGLSSSGGAGPTGGHVGHYNSIECFFNEHSIDGPIHSKD